MIKYIDKLKIKDVKHLAYLLKTNKAELYQICNIVATNPRVYIIQWSKRIKGKVRPMVSIHGRLREVLDELKSLLQKIKIPSYIHGGVSGKSVFTNAKPHVGKPMLVRIDLEKHFPSTSHHKVYRMFCEQQECSPEVARILTQLTTLNAGLPQGSPTSTFISNLVTLHLSERLYKLAHARSIKCTQYVDDYTFSGRRRLSKLPDKIIKIAKQERFKVNPQKTEIMPFNCEQVTTGVRVNGNQMDVPSSNIKDIRKELAVIEHKIINGCMMPPKAIRRMEGKIHYVLKLNPGAAKSLNQKLNRIKASLHR